MSHQKAAKFILKGRYKNALSALDNHNTSGHGADLLRGYALRGLGRHREAAASLVRCAVSGGPHAAEAWILAGLSYQSEGQLEEAIDAYLHALTYDGDLLEARNNLCRLFILLKKFSDALPHARWLLAHSSNHSYCKNSALVFYEFKMWGSVIEAVDRVLIDDPEEPLSLAQGIRAAQYSCDWSALSRYTSQISSVYYSRGRFRKTLENSFVNISWCMNQSWNYQVARIGAKRAVTKDTVCYNHRGHRFSKPLRVGYVSADFRDHPFFHLAAGVLESHDSSRIKMIAYCHSPADATWFRKRFEQAVPDFVRIADLTDEEAAERIHADGIDVLVDCMGFTGGYRPGIFARRPAPVQATWLGFPGTSGAGFMDYIIADPVVVPDGSFSHFSESPCRLPETYQCNDQGRVIASNSQNRSDHGLPAEGIVFCCMNQAYKLEPVRFGTFMAVLKDVPKSVLWLFEAIEPARENIRKAVIDAGVDPSRLVFAPKIPAPLHLARLVLADIALDTRIYTGHTTTADALWAGVPVLVTRGSHFASRVTESLLRACNMSELVTEDEASFHALAVALAIDSAKRKILKEKLCSQRLCAPLFDTERYTRHLESAFLLMAKRSEKGLPPETIDVPALPVRQGAFIDTVPTRKILREYDSNFSVI